MIRGRSSLYRTRRLTRCGLVANDSLLRCVDDGQIECKKGLKLGFGKQTVQTTHTNAVGCLSFESSEGRYLLSASDDGGICLYDCEEGAAVGGRGHEEDREQPSIEPLELEWGSKPHDGPVSHVCWYPVDNGMFFSAGIDGTVKAWDTNELTVVRAFDVAAPAHCVEVSPISKTHKLLAVASDGQHVRLCDLVSGSSSHTLIGHRGPVYSVQWSTHNEYQLISASQDNSVRLWDIRRSACVLAFDYQQRTRASTDRSSRAFWNIPTQGMSSGYGSSSSVPQTPHSHQGAVLAAYYAPDGAHVVSISSDRHMRLWDLVGGVSTTVSFGLRAPTAQRRCKASFSRDGRYMFVGNANDVHVHETASGRLVRALRGHFNEVLCTAVNPKTKDVYSAGMDESVLLWAYSKRKKKKRLQRAPASPGGGGHRQQLLFDEGDSEDDWDAMPSDASDSDSDIGRGQELPEARRRNRNARPGGADLPWNA